MALKLAANDAINNEITYIDAAVTLTPNQCNNQVELITANYVIKLPDAAEARGKIFTFDVVKDATGVDVDVQHWTGAAWASLVGDTLNAVGDYIVCMSTGTAWRVLIEVTT